MYKWPQGTCLELNVFTSLQIFEISVVGFYACSHAITPFQLFFLSCQIFKIPAIVFSNQVPSVEFLAWEKRHNLTMRRLVGTYTINARVA